MIGIRDASDAELYRILIQGDRSEPAVQQRPQQRGGPRQAAGRTQPDFDGDGKADIGVFVEAGNQFFALLSAGGIYNDVLGNLGTQSIPVSADYDGDGRADVAVWNQFNGQWFIVRANNQVQTYIVGGGGHLPTRPTTTATRSPIRGCTLARTGWSSSSARPAASSSRTWAPAASRSRSARAPTSSHTSVGPRCCLGGGGHMVAASAHLPARRCFAQRSGTRRASSRRRVFARVGGAVHRAGDLDWPET